VEANEPALSLRREHLSLQYAIKLMSNPGNPAYKSVFNPKFEPLFQVKLTAIPSFGIRNAAALREINPHKTSVCRAVVPPFPPGLSPAPLFCLICMRCRVKKTRHLML
jgi:hypothetical protein